MLPILVALHVFVSLLLVLLVLLQKSKGDSAFSPASNIAMPSSRFDFLSKLTMGLGIFFLLNGILFSYTSMRVLNDKTISYHSTNQKIVNSKESKELSKSDDNMTDDVEAPF